MNRPYRILHLVTSLSTGGVENMIHKVVTHYDRDRFVPVVCCIKSGGEVADRLVKEGFRVILLNRMKGHGFDWRAVLDIHRVLKREGIDVLRTHQYHANLYGRIAGVLAGIPVIIPSFHNLYISPERPKLHRRLINRILAVWSDCLIAVSRSVAEDIIRFDRVKKEKIRVIPNGVLIERFRIAVDKREARRSFGLPEDKWIVGSVGRLTPQKGHEYLIRAVSGLKDVVVAIAGDGPLKDDLKQIAEQTDVECLLTGTLSEDEVSLFLKALDIFCFPSLWEGMPSALVEAMAAGLPVVASDISSNIEIVNDAGIIVKTKDVNALRSAITRLIKSDDERLRYSEKAARQSERFSIENTVREYENLFMDILKEKEVQ